MLCLFHLPLVPLVPPFPSACKFLLFLCVYCMCLFVYQDVSRQWELQPGLLPGFGSFPSQSQLTQQLVLFQWRLGKLCSLEAEVHAWAVRKRGERGFVCLWLSILFMQIMIYHIRKVYQKQHISLSITSIFAVLRHFFNVIINYRNMFVNCLLTVTDMSYKVCFHLSKNNNYFLLEFLFYI